MSSLYEFGGNDVIYNELETNPKVKFFIYDSQVYYNNEKQVLNTFSSSLILSTSLVVMLVFMNLTLIDQIKTILFILLLQSKEA